MSLACAKISLERSAKRFLCKSFLQQVKRMSTSDGFVEKSRAQWNCSIALCETCAVRFNLSKRIAPPTWQISDTMDLIVEFETVLLHLMYGLVFPNTFAAVVVTIDERPV